MTMSCIRTNARGVDFEEISCLYPFLKPFYSKFELNYEPAPVLHWMMDAPMVPIVAVLLYGIGIVAGKAYFKNRSPWNWRGAMSLWNLGLSVFSAIGFVRVLPYTLHILATNSMQQALCTDPENTYGSGSTGLWVQMFILSKFPELLDTLFIVVHKKPLIFLHWYHHITVLLYCWHSYVTHTPSGIFFVQMNYGVHSVMYFYYFLMAIKIRPPWAMMVTVLQISQMFVGVTFTVLNFIYVGSDHCTISHSNNLAAFGMYGSYLFLFLQFFISRYFVKSSQKKTRKKEA